MHMGRPRPTSHVARALGERSDRVRMFTAYLAIVAWLHGSPTFHRKVISWLVPAFIIASLFLPPATPAYANVVISGRAWNDVDQDGFFDPGESGANGVTIEVDTNNDTVPEHTMVTSGGGFYAFDIPAAPSFTYRIRQQVPSNRIATTTETRVCVIPDGESCTDQNFGSFLSVQISGTTWDDLNGNALLDGGEPGLDGVTVTVDKYNDGTPDHTTVSAGGGLYSFNIPPGASGSYRVNQVAPAGRIATSNLRVLPIPPGESESDINFGSFDLIAISGQVFDDLDSDGVKDGGEPGLDGVTIQLDTGANGSVDSRAGPLRRHHRA